MSKRDMRAKRLLLAVLLAMSMQSYYAAPTWAVEAGQPAGQTDTVDGKGQSGTTTTPATEAETSAPAAGEEAAAEGEEGADADAAVPPVTYGVRSASAGNEDYGIMPLAAETFGGVSFNNGNMDLGGAWVWSSEESQWVTTGQGEIAGVTKINGATLLIDDSNHMLAFGPNAKSLSTGAVALGPDAEASGSDTAVGGAAIASGGSSVAIGSNAKAAFYNSVAIGSSSYATAANKVSFGVSYDNGKSWAELRSLEGIKDIEMKGELKGVTSINNVNIDTILAGGGADLGNITTDLNIKASDAADAATTFSVDHATGNITTAGNLNMGGAWSFDDTSSKYIPTSGQISGVTTINGIKLEFDSEKNSIIFGNYKDYSSNKFATGFGYGVLVWGEAGSTDVDGTYYPGGSSAFGYNAEADNGSSAFGAESLAQNGKSSAFGAGAIAGYESGSSSAFGYNAKALSYEDIAVGAETQVTGARGIAIGVYAKVEHENSVAIGFESVTSDANQVSFGHKKGEIGSYGEFYSDSFRSLVNIADIEMHGALTGVTNIEMHGALTGVTSINNKAIVEMEEDKTNGSLSIGTGAGVIDPNNGTVYKNALAIGHGTQAQENSVAIGGYVSSDWFYSSSASENSVAINGNAWEKSVIIGGTMGGGGYNAGMGVEAYSDYGYTTFIGYRSFAMGERTVALGAFADSEHLGSVAIGYGSTTTAANQVNFGYYGFDESSKDLNSDIYYGRSLAGISDITIVADDTAANANNKTTIAGGTITVGGAADDQTVIAGGTLYAGNLNLGGVWSSDIYAENDVVVSNGKGELTGVTKINDAVFYTGDPYGDGQCLAIGSAVGSGAGWSVSLGLNVTNIGMSTVAIGNASTAGDWNATAVGSGADAIGMDSIALGQGSRAYAAKGIALGAQAVVGEEHTNSIAIGYSSYTSKENQVSFGRFYNGEWSERRSLAGISDIDMEGNLNLGGVWSWDSNTENTIVESNGKGELTGVTKINNAVFYTGNPYGDGDVISIGSTPGVGMGWSVSLGIEVTNTDIGTVAIGNASTAENWNATVVGSNATASGSESTVLGSGAEVGEGHANSVAIGAYSRTSKENQVAFGKIGDASTYRSLAGIKNIDMTGTLNGAAVTATKFNGVTLGTDGKVNGAVITSNSFNGVTLLQDASSHYRVGDVDVTQLQTDVANKADAATVTELSGKVDTAGTDISALQATVGDSTKGLVKDTADLKVNTAGISVDDGTTKLANGFKVGTTAYGMDSTGALTAASITEGGKALAAKYAAKDTLDTLSGTVSTLNDTVGDTTKGLLKDTADLKAEDIKIRADFASADATLKNELNTEIGKKANAATTLAGYGIIDAYTKTETTTAITTATADMATNTQVTKDIGAAKTELTKAFGDADTALKTELSTAFGNADTALKTELTKAFGDADTALKTALETDYKAADATLKSTLEKAYQEADTQIKTDFAAADATLQSNIDAKVAQDAYDEKMSALDSADTALSGRADKLEAKTANFSDAGDTLTGMTDITSASATLGGVSFATGGIVTGVSSINTVKFDASGNIEGGTYNGVTIGNGGINSVAINKTGSDVVVGGINLSDLKAGSGDNASDISDLKTKTTNISYTDGTGTTVDGVVINAGVVTGVKSINTVKFDASGNIEGGTYNGVTIGTAGIGGTDTFNGISIKQEGSSIKVGGIDLTDLAGGSSGNTDAIDELKAQTAGIERDTTGTATTKIEKNTSITENGLTTNKVTVGNVILESGKLTVGAVTLTGGKLSGLTAGDITSAVSTEAVTGGQVYTVKSDLETSISGKADTTTVTALDTRVGTAETDIGNLQTATADMATKTQVTKDIGAAKTELTKAFGDADTALKTELTTAFGDADTALKTTLETAYQAADTQIKTDFSAADAQIRTDFVAADAELKSAVDTKVAQAAYDSKMSALDSADAALSGRADKLEAKTVKFSADGDTLTGMTNITSASATLGGVSFAADGAVTGVKSINTVKFDAGGNIEGGTYNGVTIGNAGINGVTIGKAGIGGTDTFNGISIKKDGADNDVIVGGINLSELDGGSSATSANTKGIERDTTGTATTKIEQNTSITEKGLTTNKVTVGNVILESGKLAVGSNFSVTAEGALTAATVNGAAITNDSFNGVSIKNDGSNYTVGDVDVTALKTTVGDAANGLVKDTAELQSMVKDTTKGLEATNKIAVANAGDIVTLKTATTGMSYAAGTTNFAGGVAATVVTAGEFNISGTAFGFSSTGALKAASINGVTINKTGGTSGSDVMVDGINLSKLSEKSGEVSGNTSGVEHSGGSGADSYTTIEKNTKIAETGIETNSITASGTVTANEFVENGKTLADIYAGKEAFEDVAELVGNNDGGLVKATADLRKDADDLLEVTTGMSYSNGNTTFSGNLVVGVASSGTHTQITDSAIIFGEGGNMQVTIDASGIHVGKGISTFAAADGGTHIDHNSLVTGTVTASNLNGVDISGDEENGLTIGTVNVNALDSGLTQLQEEVKKIQENGVATADLAGVTRSDEDEDGNYTTTIEGATSFTKDGLKTAAAAIGGVDFAAGGIVSGISIINGVAVSGSVDTGLTIGGVTLHGGLVNNVDISWLDQRVGYLEQNGGGSGGTGGGGGLNTSGISKPNPNTTVIEGSTSITSSGITTNNLEVKDELIIGKDDKDQTTINKDGITVGKNNSQSFINGTDGFVSQKGLYIGVGSSGELDTAKFSIDSSSGKLTSNVGGHSFTNSGNGAEFSNSSGTTTINGGEISTDKLWVGGNEVKVSGNGDVEKNDAINNQLSNNKDGYDYTNSFTTSEVGGTTQSASKESDDKKNKWETTNNTSADGTSITTTKTSTNSAEKTTEQSSSFVTNESGMSLNTSTKVTDKDGNVTKNTSGETKMSGDSLTVSKTTVTSKDGKEETTTSSTTVGSGEVTLHREDGSTIRVGEAIEGMQGQIQDIGSKVNEMGVEIKEVGALSAALAGLHPQPENANSRADFAMAMGSYEGKQALAVGGFYRPDKRTMLSIGASTTSSKHMMNMGISIALDRLPEEERKAQEAAAADPETLNKVLERLAALEQDNQRLQADNKKRDIAYEKLAADYTQLKEKYTEKTAEKQQSETKLEEAAPAEEDSSSEE